MQHSGTLCSHDMVFKVCCKCRSWELFATAWAIQCKPNNCKIDKHLLQFQTFPNSVRYSHESQYRHYNVILLKVRNSGYWPPQILPKNILKQIRKTFRSYPFKQQVDAVYGHPVCQFQTLWCPEPAHTQNPRISKPKISHFTSFQFLCQHD